MAWWEPQTWDWVDWATMAKTAIGAGFGTALVQGLLAIYRDRRDRKLQAAYMAMRLATILEEFVVKCADRALHDHADLADGNIELSFSLPMLAPFPQDLDWKSLDPQLAGQVLRFPNEVTSAGLACQFAGMREGNKVASADETIFAGVKAWELAQALRMKYHLDAMPIEQVEWLEREQRKILQQRKEYASRNRADVH